MDHNNTDDSLNSLNSTDEYSLSLKTLNESSKSTKESEDDKDSILEFNKRLANKAKNKENKEEIREDLLKNQVTVFGTDPNIKKPCKLGNTYCFLYIKDQPLIVIGPHCK